MASQSTFDTAIKHFEILWRIVDSTMRTIQETQVKIASKRALGDDVSSDCAQLKQDLEDLEVVRLLKEEQRLHVIDLAYLH